MLHNYLKNDTSGEHYAVSSDTLYIENVSNPKVLVQLQEQDVQARVSMTAEQAEHMAKLLLLHADKVRNAKLLKMEDLKTEKI